MCSKRRVNHDGWSSRVPPALSPSPTPCCPSIDTSSPFLRRPKPYKAHRMEPSRFPREGQSREREEEKGQSYGCRTAAGGRTGESPGDDDVSSCRTFLCFHVHAWRSARKCTRTIYISCLPSFLALSSQPPNYITLNEHLAYSINQNSSTICNEKCRARDGFLIGTHSKMLSATTMPGIRGGGRWSP
jgi:hypothetical protein